MALFSHAGGDLCGGEGARQLQPGLCGHLPKLIRRGGFSELSGHLLLPVIHTSGAQPAAIYAM